VGEAGAVTRHWIDGAWIESKLVTDVTTGLLGALPCCTPTRVKPGPRRPVGAARRAFVGHRGGATARCVRGCCWNSPSDSKHAPRELALMLTRENGKPWRLRSQSGRLAAERQPMIGGELRKRPRGVAGQPGNLVGDRRPRGRPPGACCPRPRLRSPCWAGQRRAALTKGVGADIDIADLTPTGRGQPLGHLRCGAPARCLEIPCGWAGHSLT
jgi:hypothetical protein